jgi:hypothetical protein
MGLKLPRGPEERVGLLENGQVKWTDDTETLIIGGSSGNIEMAKKQQVDEIGEQVTENVTDLQKRAINVKYPPAPFTAAVNDANYYDSGVWYVDSDLQQVATDNSSVFSALEALGVPLFCPPGNYYAPTYELSGWYYGKGAVIICKEKTIFNATIPVSQQTGIRNFILGNVPQPVLNEFYGKGAGNSLQTDAYANTAVGESALTNLTTGKRNTAIGYQAMKSNPTQYSNIAIGADPLSTGRYFTRTTAIGDNALKWAGILDPIATRHELWVNEYDTYNVWNDPTSDFYRLKTNNANVAQIIQPTGYTAPTGAVIVNPGGGFPAATQSDDVGRNIALGRDSLLHLVKGSDNVGLGYQAHAHAYTASENTAVGNYALADSLAGVQNTAIGKSALSVNQTGANNTAIGAGALPNNIIGNRNTVIGSNAGANVTSDNNILIGYKARSLSPTSSRQFAIDYGNDTSSPVPYMYGSMLVGSETLGTRAKDFRIGGDAGANGGISILTGTGVPSMTAPNGSLYTRQDGGAGSTLYVREAGAWVAK